MYMRMGECVCVRVCVLLTISFSMIKLANFKHENEMKGGSSAESIIKGLLRLLGHQDK